LKSKIFESQKYQNMKIWIDDIETVPVHNGSEETENFLSAPG